MNAVRMIGGICVIALGVAMATPQSFCWFKEMARPKHMPGRLPVYSPEEDTDFIVTMIIGGKTINLDPWLPVLFAVGVGLAGVGTWGFWHTIKGN